MSRHKKQNLRRELCLLAGLISTTQSPVAEERRDSIPTLQNSRSGSQRTQESEVCVGVAILMGKAVCGVSSQCCTVTVLPWLHHVGKLRRCSCSLAGSSSCRAVPDPAIREEGGHDLGQRAGPGLSSLHVWLPFQTAMEGTCNGAVGFG